VTLGAALPHHQPLRRGARALPGYYVLNLLHRGSDSDVYDVWSDERAARCTLKLLRVERLNDTGARAALLREGRLLRRIDHPHIVRAYAVIGGLRPAVVLETLSGATLEHAIQRRPLATADLVWLAVHTTSAVSYLHRLGYLHLDLKASNITLDCGIARVLDLNIARRPGPGRPGVGTRHYLSPEQARGGPLTWAADVWGLGMVWYEAACGRLPFEFLHDGPEFPQLLGRAAPIRTVRRLTPRFGEIIDACLEPEPASRPTTYDLLSTLFTLT
jgi:serine/threonine protein kinase